MDRDRGSSDLSEEKRRAGLFNSARFFFLIQFINSARVSRPEKFMCDTHSSARDVDPDVPMPQDRLWCLLHVSSGGPDDEGCSVLGGEHGLGVGGFKRVLRVLEESHR